MFGLPESEIAQSLREIESETLSERLDQTQADHDHDADQHRRPHSCVGSLFDQ
jgi:hypothetical protein